MTQSLDRLKEILGEARLQELTEEEHQHDTKTPPVLINSKQIFCECKTLILRPNHAKLILPSDYMLEVEKSLKFLQHSDTLFKNLVRGCYWLVDDMYKFEQIGYTKEIDSMLAQETKTTTESSEQKEAQHQPPDNASFHSTSTVANGLRYLACAECNLCPLGWFDPTTKNSYLYVW